MTRDGGLAEAIACRRAGHPEHPPAREVAELRVLEGSREAAAAWRGFSEQDGRWRVPVDPSTVLDLVLRSAALASSRDRIPKMTVMTNGRYSELIKAATSLQAYFIERSGMREHEIETLDPSRAGNGAISMFRHLDDILDYLVVERNEDLIDIDWLPRPGSRGPDADARAFAHNLTTYLVRAYGRPLDGFAVRVGMVLYPPPEGPIPTTKA